MGNCLITQLKEVVNNDNLSKVGELTLEVHPSSESIGVNTNNIFVTNLPNGTYHFRSTGDTSFTNSSFAPSTEKNAQFTGVSTTVYMTNAAGKAFFDGKYVLNRTIIGTNISVNIDDFKYMNITNMTEIQNRCPYTTGDITSLNNSFSTSTGNVKLILTNAKVTGNVENFNFDKFKEVELNNTEVYGDIGLITANCANLTVLSFSNCKGISGNAEALLQRMLGQGKTGSFTLRIARTNAKFLGNSEVYDLICTFSASSISVSYRNGTKTATYDGTNWTES